MKQMKLSEQEAELIDLIRNYKRSYPNGHPNLLIAAQEIFDDLTSIY